MSGEHQRCTGFLRDDCGARSQHARNADWFHLLCGPLLFEPSRERLFRRVRVHYGKAVYRPVGLDHVHDAPGSRSRQRQPPDRVARGVLIERHGEVPARLGKVVRPPARTDRIARDILISQRAEEQSLGDGALSNLCAFDQLDVANFDDEFLWDIAGTGHRPHSTTPRRCLVGGRLDDRIARGLGGTKYPVEHGRQIGG